MLYEVTVSIRETDAIRSCIVEAPAHRRGVVPAVLINDSQDWARDLLIEHTAGERNDAAKARIHIAEYRPRRIWRELGKPASCAMTIFLWEGSAMLSRDAEGKAEPPVFTSYASL